MLLVWLALRDVRCYEELSFRPDPGVNLLVGGNGAGKTTVLEAIGILGTLRSLRRAPDEAIVRVGADAAILRGGFRGRGAETRVEIEIRREGRRRVLLDGKRPPRHRDVLAAVPMVAFQPDDLDVVARGPALRREYLDDLAATLHPEAAAVQAEYDRALRQRNVLLRQEGGRADPVTLEVWDERLATGGAAVYRERERLLEALGSVTEEVYGAIGGGAALRWAYRPGWLDDDTAEPAVALRRALARRRKRDLEVRTTTVGPHRDDPTLLLDGRPVRTAASRGEQRTAALALRLAGHRLLTERRGITPVLLLDNVFSELDPGRVRRVVRELPTGQVLVTTTRDDGVPLEGRRWSVEGGSVR